mgnify:CR=1 FL=1
MEIINKFRRKVGITQSPAFPFRARHSLLSVIASADDEKSQPSGRLLDLALDAVKIARNLSMTKLSERMQRAPYFPDVWPGEHYKLLAALVHVIQPKFVVEIGTATGLSALALKENLKPEDSLVTFDIIPWKEFSDTVLRDSDFVGGRFRQEIADLSNPEQFKKFTSVLQKADLIFVDGPKDGKFEQELLNQLYGIPMTQKPIVIFDDIRLWNMLKIWRDISLPKLDLTSFGHWSGTGIVDWQK